MALLSQELMFSPRRQRGHYKKSVDLQFGLMPRSADKKYVAYLMLVQGSEYQELFLDREDAAKLVERLVQKLDDDDILGMMERLLKARKTRVKARA